MVCPICELKTRIIDSRTQGDRVWRRHKCLKCGLKFSTFETYAEDYKVLKNPPKERPKAYIKVKL